MNQNLKLKAKKELYGCTSLEMFCNRGALENLAKLAGKQLR